MSDDSDALPSANEFEAVRAQLVAAPVADVVANHAIGLWELAALHLQATEPDLGAAALAIDAVAALVERLGERLGAHTATLQDALANIRMAYVSVSSRD